jgi:UDP-GlcNAc3NAcA epimerase
VARSASAALVAADGAEFDGRKPMKVVSVIGARPQFIKASVVSRALRRAPGIEEVVVHTGQHFDPEMSAVFFEELDMAEPDHRLGIHGGSHGAMTGRMLEALEPVLMREAPDAVLVYGDTNSTLAGALVAAKLQLPIAHVEAGLRSFNRAMPEEINRIVTDRLSHWLFTPTALADAHLLREGTDAARILRVGDVMYDAALQAAARAAQRVDPLERNGLASGGYVLATVHRAETTDDPTRLAAVVEGLARVSKQLPVLWPLHPRTRGALERAGLPAAQAPGLRIVAPVGYLDMVALERGAAVIATDSGGVQKEAYFHAVPCVTLRDETEWGELVDAGWNRLASLRSAEAVAQAVLGAIGSRGRAVDDYGAGDAALRIARHLAEDRAR